MSASVAVSGNVIGCADVSSVPVAASQRARCQHPAAAAPLSLCGTPRRLQDSNTAGQYQLSPSLPPTPTLPSRSFLPSRHPPSFISHLPLPSTLCVCMCLLLPSFLSPSPSLLHPCTPFLSPSSPQTSYPPSSPVRSGPPGVSRATCRSEHSRYRRSCDVCQACHRHTHTHTHSHTPATQCHPASPLRQSSQRQCRSSSSAPLNNSGRGTVAACAALSVSRSRAETTCVTD